MAEEQDQNAVALIQSGFKGDVAKEGEEANPPGTVTIDVGKVEEEEKKVDPKDTSPPEGSKRWKEVYGKMKDYERQLEEVKGDKKQTDQLVDEMKRHNQKLVSSIEDMTDATKSASEEKTKVSEAVRLEDQIKGLKEKRIEATKSLDYDAADDITDTLSEVRAQLKELKSTPEKKSKSSKGESGDRDPVVQTWIDENDWFQKDQIMRDAAVAYEEQLSQEFPGEALGDILKRVKDKVVKKFHLKEDAKVNSSGSPSSLVEGGSSNGASGSAGSTVRLTPTDVMLANGLGVSLEVFAKQKSMMGGK